MRVLGVSFGYHDASACLVVDGEVVAAAAEERFTRQKHDANFPAFAIEYCLAEGNTTLDAIDQVVFHEDPHAKFSRVLTAALAPFPSSRKEFVNSIKSWLGRKLWSLQTVSSRLDLPPEKLSYLSHHFSHAVQAFMGSGFDESAILVVDAVGDWACTALFSGRMVDGRPVIERVMEVAYPNSIGLVYSAFTAYLGFSPNDSECSTMALAAFGTPVYAEQVRAIVREVPDTVYEVDQSYFNFQNFYKGAVSQRFLDTFGPAREPQSTVPFACFGEGAEITGEMQRLANVAASVQLVTEERVVAVAKRLREKVPSKNLCYAGGVSLNCVANQRLVRESGFEHFFIPPDPGDGGTSVGAALYYDAMHGDRRTLQPAYGPYLAASHDVAPDVAMIAHLKPDHFRKYAKRGLDVARGAVWNTARFESEEALCEAVSARISRGEIVGWFQGRGEIGPRALGNRSILVRPDDIALATKLSRDVKDRAAFRPYALSMTVESAPRVLAEPFADLAVYRWMQVAVGVREEACEHVRAGLHVDRTTRAQVVSAAQNPRFHRLLSTYGRASASGLGVLVNTSFNPSGYPIVATPAEALAMFARTAMDALVLDDTIVWKTHGTHT